MTRAAVILAGGAGTRLWPLSSDDNPKQFLQLFDGASLLQKTYARLARILPPESIFISTNERYRAKCAAQVPDIPAENILTEPSRRNTAPAIALCTFEIESRLGETAVAFLPSDHFIGDEPEFLRILGAAFARAEASDDLVTIGITPDAPETGFGYLELGEAIDDDVLRLRRFVEKPDRERAEAFLRAGNFAWNGGMFIWRTSVFRNALQAAAPEIASVTRENYGSMPSISIDYALMEKAPHVSTVRGEFDWSDVGSWAAIARVADATARVHAEESQNVFAIARKPVVAVGVSNVAIIESDEGILVLDLAHSDLLARVVKRMSPAE